MNASETLVRLEILQRSPMSRVQIFTLAEATAMLGVSAASIQSSIARGALRGLVQIGGFMYRTSWPQHGEAASHLQACEVTRAMRRDSQRASRLEIRTVSSAGSLAPRADALRSSDGGASSTLFGHFSVFNEWTEIDSVFEGRFVESVAPGAFTKTMREDRASMRVLLNHGRDVSPGNQPIAAITELREDAHGAYYEAELLAGVPPLVVSGLAAGQYGSSFRFNVERETLVERPTASARNPQAIPERTITEARVFEFGPVTFPAYAGATAGVRAFGVGTTVPKSRTTSAPRFQNDKEWMKWLTRA